MDKDGNDEADAAAAEGFRLHENKNRMIAGYFAARQRQYANFIKDIHNHIVETVLLKQKILEERKQHI